MRQVVTFDFDNTLSRADVQAYAKQLIQQGIEVWVLTSRYDDIHRHRYPQNPTNNDLYAVTDQLKIPRERIRFQCMRPKAEYLHLSNVIWHLDDDPVEYEEINLDTKTIGILMTDPEWKNHCTKTLDL